jgi:tRNA-specific adenosine deaminase 1
MFSLLSSSTSTTTMKRLFLSAPRRRIAHRSRRPVPCACVEKRRKSTGAGDTTAAAPAAAGDSPSVPEPSRNDLKIVALGTAIPFVGFGIMDNAILIVAGDAIDTSLGVMLGISTLCAAAIGNIVSDLAGVLLGTAVEDFTARHLRLPAPDLTAAQRNLRSVRLAGQLGCAAGITVGCVIGMFPLLLIDSDRVQARKREARLDGIFRDVVTEAGGLVGAAQTCLYLLVNEQEGENRAKSGFWGRKETASPVPDAHGRFLYAKYHDSMTDKGTVRKLERWIPLGRGIVSRAALTGESWNIANVHDEPDFVPDVGRDDAVSVRSMICVPVVDSHGRPIAVIQAVNKVGRGREDAGSDDGRSVPTSQEPRTFTDSDVQILKALASHISVSLQQMYEQEGEEVEHRLKSTIGLLKDYGLEGIRKDDEQQRGRIVRRPLFPED